MSLSSLPRLAPGTELWLVRHGETAWNREGRIQGQTDVPLSELGRDQARLLAGRLADLEFTAACSSDLKRAWETATFLRPEAIWSTDARLRESCFGEFEGRTWAEVSLSHPAAFAAWRADPLRNRPPGGETVEALRDRSTACVLELMERNPEGRLLVSTHGGTVRAITCGLLEAPISLYRNLRVDNTSITRLLVTHRGVELVTFNDANHLTESIVTDAA